MLSFLFSFFSFSRLTAHANAPLYRSTRKNSKGPHKQLFGEFTLPYASVLLCLLLCLRLFLNSSQNSQSLFLAAALCHSLLLANPRLSVCEGEQKPPLPLDDPFLSLSPSCSRSLSVFLVSCHTPLCCTCHSFSSTQKCLLPQSILLSLVTLSLPLLSTFSSSSPPLRRRASLFFPTS